MNRRRRRSAAGATRSLVTGDKTRVRITKQRRHKRQQQVPLTKEQPLTTPAAYVPSDTLPAFAVAGDPRKTTAPASRYVEPTATSSVCEKELYTISSYTSESTVSEDSDTEDEAAAATADAREKDGKPTTTFPSQPFTRFEAKIEKRGERHFTIAVRNVKTNEKWESEPTQLRDFVTDENRIPLATLDDYVKCFKEAVEAPCAAPVDLVPAFYDVDNQAKRLEISLRVRVCSMQWLARFDFHLLRVNKEEENECKVELVKVQTRLREQESEIESLKQQVAVFMSNEESKKTSAEIKEKSQKEKKRYGIYYRASSVFTATRDEVIDWRTERTSGDAFHNAKDSMSTLIQFSRSGLFAVLVVVHHSNCEDESEAFQLLLNGECVQSCFASNADGVRQTSSLVHFMRAKAGDKLAVKYTGSGSTTTEAASCIEVNLME